MVLCLFQARKNEPFLKLVSHSSEFGHLRAPLCYFCFVEGRVKSRDVLCNRGANSLDVQLDRLKQPLRDMIESTDKLLRRLPTSTQERPTSTLEPRRLGASVFIKLAVNALHCQPREGASTAAVAEGPLVPHHHLLASTANRM